MHQRVQYDTNVLIVGAGPVGMLLAYQLDRLGISCFIAERNLETTKWPKMDLTNCRSMEILRVLGLVDDYRAQAKAVSSDANFDSIFITSLSGEGRSLGDWVCDEYYTSDNVGSLKANRATDYRNCRLLTNNAST
jgi:2-polyprenyl-6-methoxyphenol hydroxylase-like FAD-dependent oxidoreductase